MAIPLTSARNPHSLPITSTTSIWLPIAASLILSTSLTMLLSALSAPMLMSVAGRLLLTDAGTHTIGIARRPRAGGRASA